MSEIKLTADSGGGTTSIKAPSTTTSNADVVLKLPVADGSSGQVLKTDGSGQLSFTSNAGTTINNNADNRVITGSGTANTLNGESNVVIDSSGRLLMGNTSPEMNESGFNEIVIGGKSEGAAITLEDDNSNVKGGLFSSDANLAMIVRTVTNHPLEFRTNNTQRMRIDTSGRVGIGTASPTDKLHVVGTTNLAGNSYLTNAYVSGSIYLGGTGSANQLSDYEEGTWTPVFQNVNTPTYTTQYGRYCKIGSIVHVVGQISIGSIDTSDGSTVNIGGLPFVGNSAAETCLFTFGRYTNLLPEAKLDDFTNVRFGGNYIMLHEGNNADISYAELNSSGTIQFSASYIINT